MKHETEFANGCSNPKTLEIYNKFINNPHCISWGMMSSTEVENVGDESSSSSTPYEEVFISFQHYTDFFTVSFNVETCVGEVFVVVPDELQEVYGENEYYGIITVDKLVELLGKMPHLSEFMIDNESGRVH